MHQEYSFEVSDEEVRKFWATVAQALTNLLKSDPARAYVYQSMVDRGPQSERLLILHDDPYSIALEISGLIFTEEERKDYFKSVHQIDEERDRMTEIFKRLNY